MGADAFHSIASDQAADLETWWNNAAWRELELAVPKAIEYGSGDLIEIGRTMAAVAARRRVNDEEAAELGIYFYLVGKMARWTDAVKHGRRPSDDTLLDLGIYIKMVQRVRNCGGWPFAPDYSEGN